MADMTVVEALAEAQAEIRQLKETIVLKDSQYHDLQMDNNFQIIKTAELADMLQSKGPDELTESLHAKAMQNAELTVQVQELRNHLNNATEKSVAVESECKLAKDKVSRLAEERKSHQRMLVELSDVVRTLGQIPVEYEKAENKSANWMAPGESLENIKRKINAIENDRQRKIEENDILMCEIEARDERVDSLQKQVLRLQAVEQDRERLADENRILYQECLARESKVEALEQLFMHINASRSEASGCPPSIPVNVMYEQKKQQPTEENIEAELKPSDDGSTQVVLSATSISHLTETADGDDMSRSTRSSDSSYSSSDDDESSFSSLEIPDDGVKRKTVKAQLSILKGKYVALKKEHEETQQKVCDLEDQLKEAKKRITVTKKKQDLREGLLREVIVQYKELQCEHDGATAKIAELEDSLLEQIQKANQAMSRNQGDMNDGQKKSPSAPKTGLQQDEAAVVEENPTFDLSEDPASEDPSEVSTINSNSLGTEKEEEEEEEKEGEGTFSIRSIKYFDENMMGEFKRLESECARLEHEYDNAIAKIASLEEELKSTQEDRDASLQCQKESEQKLLETQHELSKLRQDYHASIDQSQTLQGKLEATQTQAKALNAKQKEREEELLSVINRYKQITDEKDAALSKMEGVERELWMAKKQANRRDLIYDLKRLEQKHSDAQETIEKMQQQLKRAQTDVTLSKEDAKSTRKRMAGCHFHYKQLQQQYNDTLADKAKVDRELTRAKNEVKRFKAQEECWTEKIVGIREKRKQAEEQSKQLKEENVKLKSYCNNLLVVAAQGIPDDDIRFADMALDHLLG